ncbi:MAG: hypothetical protein U9N45_02210 [Gemmatimonadota bacterium]|nr:hypothetical protein [Gemmatimonadota bacterium]
MNSPIPSPPYTPHPISPVYNGLIINQGKKHAGTESVEKPEKNPVPIDISISYYYNKRPGKKWGDGSLRGEKPGR